MGSREAHIYPRLELARDPARRAPAYARVDGRKGVLGNGFLEIQLEYGRQNLGLGTIFNKVTGETVEMEFLPFTAWLDEGKVCAEEAAFGRISARGTAGLATLVTRISHEWFDADLMLIVRRGLHSLQKTIVFHNVKRQGVLHRVALCRHRILSAAEVVIHEGGAYFPIVFVRAQQGSLFYCGDYPGYFAKQEDNARFSFSYSPGERLEPGRSFQTLTAHLGITVNTGQRHANPYHETGAPLDSGEAQWYREQLLLQSLPAELPYTEVTGPEMGQAGPSDLEVIEQCRMLGTRHVFLPRWVHAVDAYPLAKTIGRRMRNAGVEATLSVKYETTDNLHWAALGPEGRPAGPDLGPCFASEAFRRILVETYESIAERHGFSDAEIDAAPVVACHSSGHGHLPDEESLQKAFQGLVDIAEALRETCGHVRCTGPYGCYGAGITRLFDSIPVLAEPHPLALPDLHLGRLFADMGRLYYRRSRSFLVPKRSLCNAVGLVPESMPDAPYAGAEQYPWYLYPDREGWRYNLISAIATGLRHRFHALPQDLSEEDQEFARKWLSWEHDHLEELLEGEEILDNPGASAVDGYSYAGSRGAFIFLFNPTYDSQTVRLPLHLSYDAEYVVRELYPREMNYLGPHDGLYHRDSVVDVVLEPKEARVIEVVRRSPASGKRKRPEVFGAEYREEGAKLVVLGRTGERRSVGVRVRGAFAEHALRFPGQESQAHIRNWMVLERAFEQGADTLPGGDFPGTKWDPSTPVKRNAWLCAHFHVPEECAEHLDSTPFTLNRPPWALPHRVFFVVRFEPRETFAPICTSSRTCGIPEASWGKTGMKCGIDLAPLNIQLRAWVNGAECVVHPAIAAWQKWTPNPCPVVAYFFEAGSRFEFGHRNRVVLFARYFDAPSFRGIYMEHWPDLSAKTALEVS